MAKLPELPRPVASAIFETYEREAEDWRRDHLGASEIGDENCMRKLWLSFRWGVRRKLDGRIRRLLERGKREEVWIVKDLRRAGMTVVDLDPKAPPLPDGSQPQFRYSEHGGHFSGGCDGKVLGVPRAAKTWHVLEVKTMAKKYFDRLRRDGVKKAQPGHHAQCQAYMRGMKLRRALYVAVCKDDDRIYEERIHYDASFAQAGSIKAERVIFAPAPLSRIKEDPTWFECKFCDFYEACQQRKVEQYERNCRTCASSTPERDGTWTCSLWQKTLCPEEARAGCDKHVLVPGLIDWDIVEASESERAVVYRTPDGAEVVDHGGELTIRG